MSSLQLDATAREAIYDGTRVRLQEQGCVVLAALLERPGQVVSRAELVARLWPEETEVDVEHGLNAAIKRLRSALGDDPVEPRFIETVPRRGYRLRSGGDGGNGEEHTRRNGGTGVGRRVIGVVLWSEQSGAVVVPLTARHGHQARMLDEITRRAMMPGL